MIVNNKVTLFDPSLWTNEGQLSSNLGDVIINESVKKYLNNIFPGIDYAPISSHQVPRDNLIRGARKSSFVFFGGTNALSSDLEEYNQWKLPVPHRLVWPFKFPVNDVILMGVGWWQYQDFPTGYTRAFYNRALSHKHSHSVRDSYTEQKMKQLGFDNVINTGCPTMWGLNGLHVAARTGGSENCLFTLTDYNKNPVADDKIIELILGNYRGKIFFFPQGSLDTEYIVSLSNYQKYSSRITIINRTYEDYVAILDKYDVDYIGTRLHAGIKALQLKKQALILSVDNRTIEISKDTGLPVAPRNDSEKILSWIGGQKLFNEIRMPIREIEQWKKQFILN